MSKKSTTHSSYDEYLKWKNGESSEEEKKVNTHTSYDEYLKWRGDQPKPQPSALMQSALDMANPLSKNYVDPFAQKASYDWYSQPESKRSDILSRYAQQAAFGTKYDGMSYADRAAALEQLKINLKNMPSPEQGAEYQYLKNNLLGAEEAQRYANMTREERDAAMMKLRAAQAGVVNTDPLHPRTAIEDAQARQAANDAMKEYAGLEYYLANYDPTMQARTRLADYGAQKEDVGEFEYNNRQKLGGFYSNFLTGGATRLFGNKEQNAAYDAYKSGKESIAEYEARQKAYDEAIVRLGITRPEEYEELVKKGYGGEYTDEQLAKSILENPASDTVPMLRSLRQYTSRGDTLANYMYPQENAMFYAFLGKGDIQGAGEYANSLEKQLIQRAEQAQIAAKAESYKNDGANGFVRMVGDTLVSIPENMLGSVPALLDEAGQYVTTGEYDPYKSPDTQDVRSARQTRAAGSQYVGDITNHASIGGIEIAPLIYNAGVSALESAAGGYLGKMLQTTAFINNAGKAAEWLGKNTYIFMMGSGAAQQRAEELYQRGASDKQILIGSLTAGINEALFEHFSLENIIDTDKFASYAARVLTQAGIEGSEEIATTLANQLADSITLGDVSDYNEAVRKYLAENPDMDYKTAQKLAASDAFTGLLEDGLAGMLSGFSAVNIYDAANNVRYNRQNNNIGKNISSNYQAENTVKQGLEADKDSEAYKLAKEIDDKQKAGKKVSNKALGELARTLDAELTEKSGNALEKASEYRREAAAAETVENALKENGATDEEAADLAPLVSKSILGEELTDAEQAKIENNTAAVRYMDEVGSKTSEISGETGLKQLALRVNATTRGAGSTKASDRLREGALDKVFETAMRNELKPAKLSDNEIGKANETSYKVSTTGKTTYNGKAANIDAISEIGDGNALVTLDNGETAKLSEIEFADKGEAVAWQTITSIDGITPQAASSLIAQYKNKPANVTAGVWARGIAEGYEIGRSGKLGTKEFPKAEASAKYLSNIGNDARRISETVGRQDARYEQHKEAIEVDRKNVNNKNVNDAADTLDKMGRKYKIVEGIDGDGYIEKDGTIVLNKDAKDPIGFVLKHELTHYAESSKDYDGFVKAVKGSKAYAAWIDKQSLKDGTQLQQEADYLRRLKDRYRRHGVTLTNTEAHREMIANFVGDTLFNENGVGLDGLVNGMNAADRNAVMRFLTKLADFFRRHFTKKGETAYLEHFFSQLQNTATGERADEKTYSHSAQGTMASDLQFHLAEAEDQTELLEAFNFKDSAVKKADLIGRIKTTTDMWRDISDELNSDFLKYWNEQNGKDRAFTIFKEQSGYKYNVEFSSMCKKGVPLFEALDRIVTDEAVKGKLTGKRIDALKKEVLYTILKDHGFDIPCAICYVEQARRREGDVIAAFLNGNKSGKIGWNTTIDRIEAEMEKRGAPCSFGAFPQSITTDKYSQEHSFLMNDKETSVFYEVLKDIANEEIEKANASSKTQRPLIKEATPKAFDASLKGNVPTNLALIKVLAQNPDARMRFREFDLYSSMTTHNLAKFYQPLYSLFNRQGGVSGFKTKQRPVPYMSDILAQQWTSSNTRKAGGIRNQSNSDFQMYLFLDQAQMYADLTAKGYYLQAYTKTLSELKLFGLSKAKINASLIPLVHVYYNADGTVNLEKTKENAGLGTNGELLFDDVEGIPHEEALALLADKEYSKNCCGICIGYSDKHIAKMLDDSRIQMIIGFHDKTNDPNKRYKGARYAENYNGRNEAVRKEDGKTVHLNFTDFLLRAENMVKSNGNVVHFNRKAYGWDDVPRLATALYLAECDNKGYYPAYSDYGKGLTDFSKHENYYKLLADYGLYDSEGHYSPHSKVEYNLPKTVPIYENGKLSKMETKDYIKKELQAETDMRDDLSAALSDKSENGIIPQFSKALDDAENGREYSIPETSEDVKRSDEKYLAAVNSGDMETAQKMVDEAAKAAGYDSPKLYHGTNAFGFTVIDNNAPGADGYSFWASNKEDISGTYSRYGKARQISSEISEEDIDIIIEEAEEKLDAAADKFRRAIDKNISEWVYGQTDNSYLRKLIREANPEMGSGDGVYDVLIDEVYNAFSDYLYDDLGEDYDVDEWLEDTPEGKEITEAILNAEGAASALAEVRDGEVIGGIYSLYAITDNMFELDAKGSEWNNIRPQGIEGLNKAETEGRPYRTRDIAEWAKEKGYDGVIFRNVEDNGAYGHKGRGDVYAFFKPKSQIKSADPVTYDDNGNVIPLSERFNEGNEDIRWSIPETAERERAQSIKQIERLNETVTHLRDMLKLQRTLTHGTVMTQASVARQADRLMDRWDVYVGKGELTKLLNTFYTTVAQKINQREATWEEVADAAQPVVDFLLSKQVTEKANENARETLDMIKGKAVRLNDEQRAEIKHRFGSIRAWQSAIAGTVVLRNDGTDLDTLWQSWSAEDDGTGRMTSHPEWFEPGTKSADMPIRLAETAKQLQDSLWMEEELPDEAWEETKQNILYDVYETFFDAAPIQTLADKQAKEMSELKAKAYAKIEQVKDAASTRIQNLKEADRERYERLRRDKNAKIEEVKAEARERRQRERERRKKSQLRAEIKDRISEFNEKLLHPGKNKYVPMEFVRSVAGFLKDIDIGAKPGTKVSEKLAALKVKYDALKNDKYYSAAYNEQIGNLLQTVATEIGDTPLPKMSAYQLELLNNMLRALNHRIERAVSIDRISKSKNAFEYARELIGELNAVDRRAITGTFAGEKIDMMIDPGRMFRRFAGFKKNSFWEQLYDALDAAQLRETRLSMEAQQMFSDLLNDRKNYKKLAEGVDIGLTDEEGNPVLISRGMMLSIRRALMNADNTRHIVGGGFTVPDFDLYYKGNTGKAFNKKGKRVFGFAADMADIAHQIGELRETMAEQEAAGESTAETETKIADLESQFNELKDRSNAYAAQLAATIDDQLTMYEQNLLSMADVFFDEWSKDILNEATLSVYGFKKANVEKYFPIKVDNNYTETKFDTFSNDISLENAGFMKDRVMSSKPILLQDITDVISDQIKKVSRYAAYLEVLDDFKRIYNVTLPGSSDSVQDALGKRFAGEEGKKFIENLLQDIQGGRRGGSVTLFDKARGKLAAATLTLNARVALAQAASFPTAAAELGWAPIMKALGKTFKKTDKELIMKYSPLLAYRSWGFSSTEIGDARRIKDIRHKVDSKLRWLTGWITSVDSYTVGHLWYAAEYYVDANNKDLEKGSEKYYEEVAKVFNRTIEKTQPNYTTLQRPELMRTNNELVKQLSMFMTQRLQNVNILYEAFARYDKYKKDFKASKNGVTREDVIEARKARTRAIESQIIAAATISIIKNLTDMLLHSFKKRDDDDDYDLTDAEWNLLDAFCDSLISNVVLGSEAYSFVKSRITDERYYGPSLGGVGAITDTAKDVWDFIGATKKAFADNDMNWNAAKQLGYSMSRLMGIPVQNAVKYVTAVSEWVQDAQTDQFNHGNYVGKVGVRLYLAEGRTSEAIKEINEQQAKGVDMQSTVRDYYKPMYLEAKKSGNKSLMSDIGKELEKIIKETGVYKKSADKVLSGWVTQAENDAKEKNK